MCVFKKFCFCVPLKYAGYVISVISLASVSYLVYVTSAKMYHNRDRNLENIEMGPSKMNPTAANIVFFYVFSWATIIFGVLTGMSAIVLFKAIRKDRKRRMIPFLVCDCILFVITTIYSIFEYSVLYFILDDISQKPIQDAILAVLRIYCWLSILSLYHLKPDLKPDSDGILGREATETCVEDVMYVHIDNDERIIQ